MGLILCIEDEPDFLHLLVEELQDAGHQTIEARNGKDALDVVVQQTPDLIICDSTMPEMSGNEFHEVLRSTHSQLDGIPFIMLSAHCDATSCDASAKCGVSEYITKPVSFDNLHEIINKYIE